MSLAPLERRTARVRLLNPTSRRVDTLAGIKMNAREMRVFYYVYLRIGATVRAVNP